MWAPAPAAEPRPASHSSGCRRAGTGASQKDGGHGQASARGPTAPHQTRRGEAAQAARFSPWGGFRFRTGGCLVCRAAVPGSRRALSQPLPRGCFYGTGKPGPGGTAPRGSPSHQPVPLASARTWTRQGQGLVMQRIKTVRAPQSACSLNLSCGVRNEAHPAGGPTAFNFHGLKRAREPWELAELVNSHGLRRPLCRTEKHSVREESSRGRRTAAFPSDPEDLASPPLAPHQLEKCPPLSLGSSTDPGPRDVHVIIAKT